MRAASVLVSALVLAAAVRGQEPRTPEISPFTPVQSETAPTAPKGNEPYRLAGFVANNRGGLISVLKVQDKRSVWIPIGGTVENITAVSYDARLDQAVIRVDGLPLTITLPKPTIQPLAATPTPAPRPPPPVVAAGTPAPAPSPGAPANPPPLPPPEKLPAPGTPEFAEREARMLVSDLLEIGLEQRKAYEAAQREAAKLGNRAPRAEAATASPK